jgi:hypothetical protein
MCGCRDKAGAVGEAGECVTLAVVSGEISVGGTTLKAGDFALLPASMTAQSREVSPENAVSQVAGDSGSGVSCKAEGQRQSVLQPRFGTTLG